ncbi:E3 ubiquitin-protein ligase UPL5-like [Lotus japonicus]|uniref:E3 ubiquitin-protein ligase UPL5-like n=1 Tax=Lotus japonicus TaxID=34305 RepID=UPI00258AC50D|nr:E3 ubiquitin-protein ligase UPL5-like [Lotus japonicus]
MSVIETPSVHHHRKRKHDEIDDDEGGVSDIDPIRMKKDDAAKAVYSAVHHRSIMLQFFVRMMGNGNTIVMQAHPDDTVQSIHERIQALKGIPVFEQRLIYNGKQLQSEQTLAECSIGKDASLQLVGRMRSTGHPHAWQVINDMVSLVIRLCHNEPVHDANKTIKGLITSYLNLSPKNDNDSASGYFQIFMSATAVLVSLYLSPYTGNKDCADSSIRHFLTTCKTTVSPPLHTQCARVVLDFCTLLKKRVSSEDPLYGFCRSTFGSLLETARVYCADSEGDNVKGSILVQEIFPFVSELAKSLLVDLDLSIDSPSNAGTFLINVADFTAFLVPLRARIMEQQALRGSMPTQKRHKEALLVEEIEGLHLLYNDLLNKTDQCLQKLEQTWAGQGMMQGEDIYPAWSHYLSILKELYLISKLYDGAEEKLWKVLTRQRSVVCLLIVRYAKRTDEHQWILEHKCVTNFESRRHLAMMMFPEVKEDYEELHEMLIDRSQLLSESFEYIARADTASLHAGLFMEFKNEEATGPGVLREWFLLVCQALFNPQNALFVACPNDRRRFYPNHASKVHPLHLEYFGFSGRVIALALMHKVQVGIVLDRVFFLQLAGKHITLEDVKDADPFLYSSCKQILEMDSDFIDSDALGLTFVREVEELGDTKVVELCPGGKNLIVNSKNREKYIDLLIKDRFVTSISEQVSHFSKGFTDILSSSKFQQFFFQSLELEDLDWMLHGSEDTISVEDWKAHTEYNGYKETDIQITWFWEIVGRMTAEQRKVLLFFWTSVKYLPVEGFCGLASRLYIYKSPEPEDRLPSSHTCFYRMCFPAYSSMTVMQERLEVITQEHIGCSFGTW